MLRVEFLSYFVSFDSWPAKKVRKLKKANQRELVWSELIKAKWIDEDPDFEGSELREDQSPSPCAKKTVFHGHQPYFYRIIAKNRLPTFFETLAGHECKFGVFWLKMVIFEVSGVLREGVFPHIPYAASKIASIKLLFRWVRIWSGSGSLSKVDYFGLRILS
jgi:hypothetical protein